MQNESLTASPQAAARRGSPDASLSCAKKPCILLIIKDIALCLRRSMGARFIINPAPYDREWLEAGLIYEIEVVDERGGHNAIWGCQFFSSQCKNAPRHLMWNLVET